MICHKGAPCTRFPRCAACVARGPALPVYSLRPVTGLWGDEIRPVPDTPVAAAHDGTSWVESGGGTVASHRADRRGCGRAGRVVTLINTLSGDGGSTAGTTRDGDKAYGTPLAPPRTSRPEEGRPSTRTEFGADEDSATTERGRGTAGQGPDVAAAEPAHPWLGSGQPRAVQGALRLLREGQPRRPRPRRAAGLRASRDGRPSREFRTPLSARLRSWRLPSTTAAQISRVEGRQRVAALRARRWAAPWGADGPPSRVTRLSSNCHGHVAEYVMNGGVSGG